MVAAAYGLEAPARRLRELTRTTQAGTDLAGILAGAEALGFEGLAAELPYDDLVAGDLLPSILHWDRDHFVVAADVLPNGALRILDPAAGERELSRDEVERHRAGPGRTRAGLVLRATEALRQNAGKSTADITGAPERPDGVDETSSPAAPPRTWREVATALLAAGGVAVLAYVVVEACRGLVDLHYREGLAAYVGSLLLGLTAAALTRYLARGQAVDAAAAWSAQSFRALAPALATGKVPADGTLTDVELLRRDAAFGRSETTLGLLGCAVAVAFALALDAATGIALLLASLLVAAVSVWRSAQAGGRLGARAMSAAREHRRALAQAADLRQTGLLRDFAGGSPELAEAGERAAAAFATLGREHSAHRQLTRATLGLALVAVLSFAGYRLGYGGLQLGSWLALALLSTYGLIAASGLGGRLRPSRELVAARARLHAALREEGESAAPPVPRMLSYRVAGETFEIVVPQRGTLAIVGGDGELRRAIGEALMTGSAEFADTQGTGDRIRVQVTESAERVDPEGYLRVRVRAGDELHGSTIERAVAIGGAPERERVRQALALAGLDEGQFAGGLSHRTDAIGYELPTSVLTRLALARAVYQHANLTLLDGATDELSAYEEALLLDGLREWAGEHRLLVVLARRASAAHRADHLVYLRGLQPVEVGSHDNLLRGRSSYLQAVEMEKLSG